MAVNFVLSAEFLCGFLNSLVFMLIGVACVLGRRCFNDAAADTCRQAFKRYRYASLPAWPWASGLASRVRDCMALSSATIANVAPSHQPRGTGAALVPGQEQLASEVAYLLKLGRLHAAIDLLGSARMARGSLQPGPSCFRLVLQKLAQSASKPGLLARVLQEISLSTLPVDPLSEGCYVRCLCRGASGDVEKAHNAYNVMLAKGISPDLRTLECLIEACLRADRHELVKPLILALDDHGLEPSATLYAELITSCASTGAVACGMVAFEQMRLNFDEDPTSVSLAYSSAIYMCAQNQQVDRALVLLAESRQLSIEKGMPPATLEGRVLPPLLAVAVQIGRAELALDLAHRACVATATNPQDTSLSEHLSGLCKLLSKRNSSRALMAQVSAIISGKPCASLPPEEHALAVGSAGRTIVALNRAEAVNHIGTDSPIARVCTK